MKDIYVVLAFHAHELLWDLPERLLSTLNDENPMKNTILDENYIKKRKEENRDVYSLGIQLGEQLNAPICVEYSNELLQQIVEIIPEIFDNIRHGYRSGKLYPLYGFAHHTHTSLLKPVEITQEIVWNMQFLHSYMEVPYPKYKGLFAAEASYDYSKLEGIEQAGIDYVIFPHLRQDKVRFSIIGRGDYIYKPFLIKTQKRNILALPRNFSISQEIWRPITRMKRNKVKNQGYKLGDYPVFYNEYLSGQTEQYPISLDEGIELYKMVLRHELNQAPPDGLLLYIQDLELMDFGDLAIEILAAAWQEILEQDRDLYHVHFVTPDQYIDRVLKEEGIGRLPEIKFQQICWAPEIRPVLRTDGHYPPLGVTRVGQRETDAHVLYEHPLAFWENGKYYCGIFDTLLENFNIPLDIPIHAERLIRTGYNLPAEEYNVQAVMYLRLMKRSCNWGWRPTEGRQKLPCLKGYLICRVMLEKIEQYPDTLLFRRTAGELDGRHIVGLVETLQVLIDCRLNYLRFGLEKYMAEHGGDLSEAYREMELAKEWKEAAIQKALELYRVNRNLNLLFISKMKQVISLLQDYSRALFIATEHIQKVWGAVPDVEYLVDRMYEYLYEQYPPLFPAMLERIDAMTEKEVESYFENLSLQYAPEAPFVPVPQIQ